MDVEGRAYALDRLASADILRRRVSKALYEAALERVGGTLCLSAAERLSRAGRGDNVFIITGFPMENVCETDGPPGAAVLAYTLRELGLNPALVTDRLCEPVVRAVVEEKFEVEAVSIEGERAEGEAEKLLESYEPAALIAVERPGWNSKGEYHNMRGLSLSHRVGKTDYLFLGARRRGIPTIAVGDGGNELGCGLIEETVRRYVPNGDRCSCPCGGGIAASTPADVLVIAATSNWGAYTISATLSLLEGAEYRHDGKRELLLLERILKAGGVDGVTGEKALTVDGIPTVVNQLAVELIWAIASV
ncbi:MAG: hypothetical protein AYL28_000310 [Candidatus Bathyarchaeota archaeon B23]|nr:MAG: hypothetical protein AYL28_000310 [Candidatus Bathyarchaeota archaeon B23]